MRTASLSGLLAVMGLGTLAPSSGQEAPPVFEDDFSAGDGHWQPYFDPGNWKVADGVYRSTRTADCGRLADVPPAADVMIEARVRVAATGRANFGLAFRTQPDRSCLVLRYYDRLDALELLEYTRGRSRRVNTSERVSLIPGKWYRMKGVVCDRVFLAKIWLANGQEPDWQLEAKLGEPRPGGAGLFTYDHSTIEFDDVRIGHGPALAELQASLARERTERERRIREALRLQIVASPFVIDTPDGPARRLDVVTRLDGQRYAVDGELTVVAGDQRQHHTIRQGNRPRSVVHLRVAEPRAATEIRVSFEAKIGKTLESRLLLKPAEPMDWRAYVKTCLDTLIDHGTDRYGSVSTAMLMSILDVYTLASPEHPPMLDGVVRTEGRPMHGRRSPGGSNLWMDMAAVRVMYRMSESTGEPKYGRAADAYLEAVFEHAVKPNGLLYWGTHSYYNAFADKFGGDGVHEILIKHPEWDRLYALDPQGVRKMAEASWEYHVPDKVNGQSNRHDSRSLGYEFAYSSGSFGILFGFLHERTGEAHYLEKAKLLARWHLDHRHPMSGLVGLAPAATRERNGKYAFNAITGPYASQLLRTYELTGDAFFRDAAIGYIKAYEKYAWDETARNYYGMLELDGTPIVKPVYDPPEPDNPVGHVDVWRTIMYTFEFPLIAAQTAVYAYELADDEQDRGLMLQAALRWAEVIEKDLPPKTGRRFKAALEAAMPEAVITGGTYAENYGRAISFFVGLYHVTHDAKHLRRAEQLARGAIEKLYVNGLFRGHPAKPYYQATDGVGFLLHALMQLDALPDKWRPAF